MPQPARDGFTSTLGVLLATLGSAVGLGNIWKFPSLTGMNGGAGFLLVYLLATLLIGLPVMIVESTLGRTARANAVTTFEKIAPRQGGWKIIGWMGAFVAILILAFYSEVAGWVCAYIVKSVSSEISTTDPRAAGAAFEALVADPVASLAWQWGVLGVTGGIIMLGVSRGIEAVTRRLMPLLFLLLLVLCARGLTLPGGAVPGLAFLFSPDFARITPAALLTALGLAFFKLSLGMGTILTYGSYYREDQNIPATALRVMLADLSISLLAGVAIFPAVFAFGFEPAAGPSLVFMTIPAVFASMPGGAAFMAIFFLLTAVASVGAILSMLEVPVAILSERLGLGRKRAALCTILVIALVGAPAALSHSLAAGFTLFGKNAFDLYDFLSSNVLMPLGGILVCLFAGWVFGLPRLERQLSNEGRLSNGGLARVVFFLVRYVAPSLILVVLLNGLGVF